MDAVWTIIRGWAIFADGVVFVRASLAPAVLFLPATGRTQHDLWAVLFGCMASWAIAVGRAQHARARVPVRFIVPRQTPALVMAPFAVQGWVTHAVAAAGVARGVNGGVALVVAGCRDDDAAVGKVALAVKGHQG